MKKLLLSIAFILVASITMAQRVVTAINTEKYYTLECRSGVAHNTARFIGVTENGVINGQSATAAEIKFEAAESENGYYIKIGEKYLNHNGTNISASTEKSTVWTFGVGGKDNVANVVTFTIGNNKYLNNNGSDCNDGTCTNLKANSHAGGPGSGNSCSLWQLCEIDPNYKAITDPADFKNGEVYTFVTTRGWMGAKEDNNNVISTAYAANGVAGSKDDDYFLWTVYKSENNNYYLYNIGKQMFMGVQASNNAAVPFAATPQGKNLTFKKSGSTSYPIMFSTDNAGVVNHSANHASGLITWTGGWSNPNDDGSNHIIEMVATLDDATLAQIKELVEDYELDNTEAVAALSEAVTNAQTLFGQITIGDGLGEYTATDEDYESKFFAIIDFISSIESTKTPTPAEVEAKIDEVNAIIASFVLNMPEAGKYYRIAYNYGDQVGTLYMQGVSSDVKGVKFTADKGAESIWYYDGTLMSYTAGKYLVEHGNTRGLQDVGETVEFSASPRAIGKYCIKIGSFVHANSSNGSYFTDHCGSDGGHATHDFILEEVTWQVVAVSPTAGVVEKIETITIQFNQPVVVAPTIEIAGCEFVADVTEATETVTYTTATPIEAAGEYVLNIAEVADVAFANGEPDSYAWVIEDVSTAVEVVVAEKENEIYDITGRKVKNISKAGIYIVNGCKVLVK